MARLRSSDIWEQCLTHTLKEPPHDPKAAQRNGPYRGDRPVRVVPQGVSGRDLVHRRQPAGSQLWVRGEQLVRVLRMEGRFVVFRELTHGRALRRMRLTHFLRTSHPREEA
jgi:hypothetical protein